MSAPESTRATNGYLYVFHYMSNIVPTLAMKTANPPKLSIGDAQKAQHPYISYCVAKAESEKAIWKYVEAESPHYSVTVLLPALIFGPPIQPVFDLKKINYSTDVFYSLFNGTYEVTPPTSFPSYVSLCSPPSYSICIANIYED
jgi:nucleoside-diphosphate-sugar epimerase